MNAPLTRTELIARGPSPRVRAPAAKRPQHTSPVRSFGSLERRFVTWNVRCFKEIGAKNMLRHGATGRPVDCHRHLGGDTTLSVEELGDGLLAAPSRAGELFLAADNLDSVGDHRVVGGCFHEQPY